TGAGGGTGGAGRGGDRLRRLPALPSAHGSHGQPLLGVRDGGAVAMAAEHTYRHGTYTMRRGGVRRLASKVTRDDGAVARLTDLLPAELAIERARALFDVHVAYNGTRPEDLSERIERAQS